jgi:hypothetical protein
MGSQPIWFGCAAGRTAAYGVQVGFLFQASTYSSGERHHFEAQHLTMVEIPDITMGRAVDTLLVASVGTEDPHMICTAGTIAVFRRQ